MSPVNAQKVIDKMAKYIKEATPEPPVLPALLAPNTLQTTYEFRVKWSNIQSKICDQLSSPIQRQFESIERRLQTLLDISDITRAERDQLYIKISAVVHKKPTSRYRIQKGRELTAAFVQQLIREKDEKRRLK